MAGNKSFNVAKIRKEDEFYTQLTDIEKELRHYKQHFKDKVVLCNCDDPRVSNFWKYFTLNFEALGLKRVIATCYKNTQPDLFSTHECERAVYQIYEGDRNGNRRVDADEIDVRPLKGDGDFRSAECVELLKQADIVCTNPPFSLFREYVAQLMTYEKKFLIIGNQNNVIYRDIFRLMQQNKMWLGYNSGNMEFRVPKDSEPRPTRFWIDDNGQKWRSLGNICWFTNLDIPKRHESLILYKHYTPEEYLLYDNYNAINVDKVAEIPIDYEGIMGVPVTYLDKHNPDEYEIIGITRAWDEKASKVYPEQIDKNGRRQRVSKLNDGPALRIETPPIDKTYYEVNGIKYLGLFQRILIRRKKESLNNI